MANITFDEVVKLAEQLSPDDQKALISHLQQLAHHRELTFHERRQLLEASILSIPVVNEPSLRREDWYDDDEY
jgi:hypothetical protein